MRGQGRGQAGESLSQSSCCRLCPVAAQGPAPRPEGWEAAVCLFPWEPTAGVPGSKALRAGFPVVEPTDTCPYITGRTGLTCGLSAPF